jgi:hypothetical protein
MGTYWKTLEYRERLNGIVMWVFYNNNVRVPTCQRVQCRVCQFKYIISNIQPMFSRLYKYLKFLNQYERSRRSLKICVSVENSSTCLYTMINTIRQSIRIVNVEYVRDLSIFCIIHV